MIKQISLLFCWALLFTAISGCGKQDSAPQNQPVRLFAAVSTKEAVTEIAQLFTKENGTPVTIVAESSSKLAMQIVNAAPADLFLSANQQWADFVNEKGYAQEIKPLLTNRLALIVPKGNPAGVAKPEDLLSAKVKRVALAGPSVPAGIYGRQSLTKLGLLEKLSNEKKIVEGDDVRSTLTYVERGEADAGIVYDTDAKITDKVEIVHRFDSTSHDPIVYPMALLKAGHESARKLFEFMQSEQALELFQRHGFAIAPGRRASNE